jgi:hypothetical protein
MSGQTKYLKVKNDRLSEIVLNYDICAWFFNLAMSVRHLNANV